MGACNQGEKVWNFYGGVVTRRTLVRLSRNNMKGALYQTLKSFRFLVWVKRQKGKFQFFIFGVLEVGVEPLTQQSTF